MTKLREMAEKIENDYQLDYSLRFAGYPQGVDPDTEMADVLETALRSVVEECIETVVDECDWAAANAAANAIKTRFGLERE